MASLIAISDGNGLRLYGRSGEDVMRNGMFCHWAGKAAISISLTFMAAHVNADPILYKTRNSEIQFIDGNPRKILIHTVSPAQQNVRILGRSFTDDQCRVTRLANYEVITAPVNGSVCYREETLTMSMAPFGNPDGRCLGHPALARVVYYIPHGAFQGQDTFQYALIGANHQVISIADVDITLTPARSSSRHPNAENSSESNIPPKETGAMARCLDPIS
ncbi:MAG: hypothetical protein JO094_17475 [Hyphomicrobiales bacterium]|nr:hypothetical protein [Hyphomicrobiales bacterium]